MSMEQSDANVMRDRIGSEWNATADGWKKWESSLHNFLWPVSQRMIAAAKLQPGMRVLDVGTGTGDLALHVAHQVGNQGSVLGIDLSGEMLKSAKSRATSLRLDNTQFKEAAADLFAAEPQSFDAIVGRFSVIFFPDVVAGLSHLRSLVKPEGRVCFSTWTSLPVNRAFAIPLEAIRPYAEGVAVDEHAPGPLQLSGEGQFADALVQAGFTNICEEEVSLYQFAPSPEAYWQMLVEVSSSFRKQLEQLSESDREGVRESVMRSLAEWTVDGVVRVPARARAVAASPVG